MTGKCTSTIHAPIEQVREFLENPHCELAKREHKAMNDNDLNTFPIGLLWSNEEKTTRYTQQIFKFTKEVAIQTLCQVVTVEEDDIHESDEEVRKKTTIETNATFLTQRLLTNSLSILGLGRRGCCERQNRNDCLQKHCREGPS